MTVKVKQSNGEVKTYKNIRAAYTRMGRSLTHCNQLCMFLRMDKGMNKKGEIQFKEVIVPMYGMLEITEEEECQNEQ